MQSQGPISIVTRESALRQGDIREGLTLVNALPITVSVFINLEMAVGLDEWPLMSQGHIHAHSRDLSLALVHEIAQFEPATENLKAVYPLIMQQALELRDERRARTGMAVYRLPVIEWIVLCAGAVITIVFTYFFRLESHRIQLAMTGMVALLIALNLYLIALFAAPYSGDLRVKPDPILKDLDAFDKLIPIDLQPEVERRTPR
jgi:hypothetical protein